ncbi:DUF6707 family protein [Pseudarthrobacter sp. N5]|uniref:DUF6707 family protein n=1 Tax=Pseudarthrobacter sp. N5 TaxID=3418416 RepID=UPI003CEE0949
MTHNPAAQHYSEQQAGSLKTGDQLLLPDGGRSAEIQRVELENDDFGIPALVLATLAGGGLLRIAAGSTVRILDARATQAATEAAAADAATADATPAATPDPATVPDPVTPLQAVQNLSDEDSPAGAAPAVVVPPLPATTPLMGGPTDNELALIPGHAGTPESVVEAASAAHPDEVGVLLLADKLAKGINTKSGSCLKDLSDLAHELFIMLRDPDGALAVADLLNVLPFDGNHGRWASVQASLALSSYICRQTGREDRAEVYEKLLRSPETQETDPFKARMQAKVRQRSLNEPNLYDKEIFRSIDNSNREAEREWRLLRLESLLLLRAHGGSETIGPGELQRRIAHELESVRG